MNARKTATEATPDLSPLLERLGHVERLLAVQKTEIDRLAARLEVRIRQHDATIQMHCDHALALRQVSGALEDLVRRVTK